MSPLIVQCDLTTKQVEEIEEFLSLSCAELFWSASEVAAMTPVTDDDRIRQARALMFCAAAREWMGRVTYPLSIQLTYPKRKQLEECWGQLVLALGV